MSELDNTSQHSILFDKKTSFAPAFTNSCHEMVQIMRKITCGPPQNWVNKLSTMETIHFIYRFLHYYYMFQFWDPKNSSWLNSKLDVHSHFSDVHSHWLPFFYVCTVSKMSSAKKSLSLWIPLEETHLCTVSHTHLTSESR